MTSFSKTAKVTASLLVLAGVGLVSAFTSNSASQSISVRAEVPLNCRVALQGGAGEFNASGVATLGSTDEFCNSANGYRIFARAEGEVEGASIIVDGRSFPLTAGVEFPVVQSAGPAVTSRTISYDAGDTDGGGRLTLRIQAN